MEQKRRFVWKYQEQESIIMIDPTCYVEGHIAS